MTAYVEPACCAHDRRHDNQQKNGGQRILEQVIEHIHEKAGCPEQIEYHKFIAHPKDKTIC
jgi:hypothetical protein